MLQCVSYTPGGVDYMDRLIHRLIEERVAYLQNEPLFKHTSFRIGGPAELMVFPHSVEELSMILQESLKEKISPVILGAGTNVLAPDAGKRGLIICTKDCLTGIYRTNDSSIAVKAGVLMSRVASFARDESLTGLEFAHGIPGTVGGGIYMNAGAYGGEIKQIAEKTTIMNMDGQIQDVVGTAQGFGYRKSVFQDMNCIIVESVFKLSLGNKDQIQARMQDLALRRRTSQPLDMPSAGSTFKRPQGGYAAALIEAAGLKGQGVGGAQVSTKHAGFVVNCGGATEYDVMKTIEMIQKRVYESSGILLETEIKRL